MKRARFTDEQIIGMLKALEDENAELKKLLAEAMLDNAILKDVASKKMVRPAQGGVRWPMSAKSMI